MNCVFLTLTGRIQASKVSAFLGANREVKFAWLLNSHGGAGRDGATTATADEGGGGGIKTGAGAGAGGDAPNTYTEPALVVLPKSSPGAPTTTQSPSTATDAPNKSPAIACPCWSFVGVSFAERAQATVFDPRGAAYRRNTKTAPAPAVTAPCRCGDPTTTTSPSTAMLRSPNSGYKSGSSDVINHGSLQVEFAAASR